MATTRDEHLAWCKKRALQYLPANPTEAMTSMFSDLGKHPDTANHSGIELGTMLLFGGQLNTAEKVRNFVEGFN